MLKIRLVNGMRKTNALTYSPVLAQIVWKSKAMQEAVLVDDWQSWTFCNVRLIPGSINGFSAGRRSARLGFWL